MGNSLSVRLHGTFQNKREESWWERVAENARAFVALRGTGAFAHSGAGAFDLLDARPEPGTRRRQAASILVHAAVIGGLLLLGSVPSPPGEPNSPAKGGPVMMPFERFFSAPKPDGGGKGSNHDLLPPTVGNLVQHSQIVLLRPHLPTEQNPELPVEPTLFDANAAAPTHVRDIGSSKSLQLITSSGGVIIADLGDAGGIASENLSESPRPSIEAAPKGQLRRFCLFDQ